MDGGAGGRGLGRVGNTGRADRPLPPTRRFELCATDSPDDWTGYYSLGHKACDQTGEELLVGIGAGEVEYHATNRGRDPGSHLE